MACVYGTAAFAAETWWQGPEAKGYTGPIKALDRAFATAARAIAPAYATVPIAALFREAGIHRAKPFCHGEGSMVRLSHGLAKYSEETVDSKLKREEEREREALPLRL